MTEGLAYLGSFVSMYQDLDIMWNNEYAAFSGNCPVYRLISAVSILAVKTLLLQNLRDERRQVDGGGCTGKEVPPEPVQV